MQDCAEKMPKKEIWSISFKAGMRERESRDERRGGWREIQRERGEYVERTLFHRLWKKETISEKNNFEFHSETSTVVEMASAPWSLSAYLLNGFHANMKQKG